MCVVRMRDIMLTAGLGLRAMGVGQAALKWFDSYLGSREQTVEISGVFSEFRTVTCGVPQGSILGPLLFLIYVNDMKAAVRCKLLLYADDPYFWHPVVMYPR